MMAPGDFIITGVDGTRLSEAEKQSFEDLNPLGICLFSKNFRFDLSYEGWFEEYSLLLEDIRAVSSREKLIISIDQEGGRVLRPPEPITAFPYPIYWKDKYEEVSAAMAEQLKSLAVNLVYAPVLDVHSNPKNPVIGPRAFASSAQSVSDITLKVASVLRKSGVLPCGKHFPGHGDTGVDSHYALPVLQHDLTRLNEVELKPFRDHIAAGIEMIMTAHVQLPILDRELPATQSAAIISGLLRQELGFEGVVITDSLHMGAVDNAFLNGDGVTQAINAGVDILLMGSDQPHDLARSQQLGKRLQGAIQSGEIDEKILVASLERLKRFVTQIKVCQPKMLAKELFEKHQALADRLRPDSAEHYKNFVKAPLLPAVRGGDYAPV